MFGAAGDGGPVEEFVRRRGRGGRGGGGGFLAFGGGGGCHGWGVCGGMGDGWGV